MAAFHSGRMFDEADVDGGSCEEAAREHSNEFGNLAHRLPPLAHASISLSSLLFSSSAAPDRDSGGETTHGYCVSEAKYFAIISCDHFGCRMEARSGTNSANTGLMLS